MAQYRANSEYASLVNQAFSTWDARGESAPDFPAFNSESFKDKTVMGYRAEAPFRLIEEDEVKRRWGNVNMKDLQSHLSLDVMTNHRGEEKKGFLIEDGPCRYILYRDVATELSECHANGARQLRAGEAKEVGAWYRREVEKSHPHGRQRSEVQTLATLELAAKKVQEEKLAQDERKALEIEPPPSPSPAAAVKEEPEMGSSEDEVELEANADSPQLKGPKGKAKPKAGRGGKDSSKAKAKSPAHTKDSNKAAAKPKAPASSRASSVAGSDVGGESVKSGGSNSKKKTSGEGYVAHVEALNLDDVLAGIALGVKRWHAEQELRKMRSNEKLKDGPGCVLLQAKLSLFNQAEKPTMQRSMLSEADRAKLVQKALVGDAVIPAIMKGRKEFVRDVATKVLASWPLEVTAGMPVLECAVGDVRECCTALVTLLTETHSPAASECVQSLLSAKLGCKMLIKQVDLLAREQQSKS